MLTADVVYFTQNPSVIQHTENPPSHHTHTHAKQHAHIPYLNYHHLQQSSHISLLSLNIDGSATSMFIYCITKLND